MHTQAIQLDLFEDTQSPTIEEVHMKWSHSRRDELERCSRKYYYHYYGSKVQLALTEPLKPQLRELSKLSNRHLRAGRLLHLAIGTYLNSEHIGGGGGGLIDWVVRIFRQDRYFSETNQVPQNIDNQKYPPTCLLEFYYRFDDAGALYEEAEDKLVAALTHFLSSDKLELLRFGGRRRSALVEKPVSVDDALFAAQGRIDIAFQDDTGVTIADWKIGSWGGTNESLQLGFYALWGTQEYDCALEDITVYTVYLADEEIVPFTISEVELRRVRARIIQDLEKMALLAPYGSKGMMEVFKPCNQPKNCALCRYQGPCLKQA